MASLLWYTVLAVASTAVIWKGSTALESTSERLARHYGLPPIVQGSVVAAVGSSFPELSSTVISTVVHGQFDLGIGAIVGSAIFNILVIPALSGLKANELGSSRDIVYKEAQFYMLSVAALLVVFSFAVIYFPAPAAGDLVGTVTRPLALAPVLLYGLYVFIQYQDTMEHEAERPEDVSPLRQWAVLAVSLVVIIVAVEGLVKAAIGFGNIFGTPSFLWGLTVIAAGTSLPDAIVSVRAAQGGSGVTSLGNVLGSNIFDLLVAIPAGVLVAGSATVNFAAAVPMMAYLILATIVLFTALRTDLNLSIRECYTLLGMYVAFLGWMVLETMNVLHLVPGA